MIFHSLRPGKLLLLLMLISLTVAAQKGNYFHVSGRIRVDNGDPAGAVVTLTNVARKTTDKTITLNATGKFELDLTYFTDYHLSITKEDHYNKEIDVSTVVPAAVWEKDSIFPPFPIVVTLYKKVPDVTLSFEGKTVGRLCYSPKGKLDNFDSDIFIDDKDIRREIDQAIKAHEDELFNKKMAEAVEFEKKNQIREAIKAYEEALALRKNDPFIKPKLKELSADLKNLEKDALLEAEFSKLLASGDDNVAKQKYPEAIDNFKAALTIRPGNQTASEKLTNAEQLLAKVNADKARLDAEFNRLLTSGDGNVAVKRYVEAIADYKSALGIKPGDAGATAKLSNAERLLADSNADKARQEAEFTRLLAAGDANVGEQKYPEAIANFKSALTIKPGDATATAKLANAEQLLAKVNADKARQEAEFTRLLAAGDANVGEQKYPEAIANFKSALVIKPGDATANAKLTNAEQLLAKVNADKARQEAEFTRLLAAGDVNVGEQKYPEAIANFKSALVIKPGDATATAKLTNAEQLLAKVNADKARQEAEFARLLAAGDANVGEQKYPEAIANYKSALVIKPGDATATAKLANAEQLLARVNADKARQEAEFTRLLAAGDVNVGEQKYPEAIANFKSALVIKPGDATATAKLTNAEQLLAKINADKAKRDAEFDRLLTIGDGNVAAQKYVEAIDNFKSALNLKAGDKTAVAKLDNAQQLLAKANADKANLEAQFNRFLSAGDANVAAQKYPDAIENFKGALTIKKGDPTATAKLANAEQLLTRLNSEFSRLLGLGDSNVAAQKYPEAIVNFKEALKIRPGDPTATAKLAEAEKLLAQYNADQLKKENEQRLLAEKQRKYKEAIAKADQLFAAKSLPAAKDQYREAIKISDAEQYPKNQIVAIDSLLAQLERERLLARQQAEAQRKLQGEDSYQKNIQTGDANFGKSLWTLAIFYYQEALKFKAGDKYALDKIDNCKKMIDGNITAAKMQEYNGYVKRADEDMQAKKYSSARFYYGKASGILPWESYPQGQLKMIEKVISTADLSGVDAQYFEAVSKADEAVKQKNYAIARFYFQRAASLKPDEEYPKQQLIRISSQIQNSLP